MERVRTSMECLSWFLLPYTSKSPPFPASSSSLGDCSERHLTPACGALIWPCLFLGSQVQRFLKNNRIKYLKSPTQLPCKRFVKGTSTTYLPGHLLDIQTGYCISDSGKEISWVTSPSKFQSKQMVPSRNIHPNTLPHKKQGLVYGWGRGRLWMTHMGSLQGDFCTLWLWWWCMLISF